MVPQYADSPTLSRPAIQLAGLWCRRGGNDVLKGIDMEVEAGTVLGVLGPNGCGKSTLLRCIAGLEQPSAGDVSLEGRAVRHLSPSAIARRLALQGQDSDSSLGFSVRDVIGLGRLAHRSSFFAGASERDKEIVEQALMRLELTELAERPVETLSGGERQRVVVARALAQEPAILLLDEPTNHLDIQHRFSVLDLVRELGVTVVAVLHDIELAARSCDRIVLMKDGLVVSDGPPALALTPRTLRDVFSVHADVETHPRACRLRIELSPLSKEPAS